MKKMIFLGSLLFNTTQYLPGDERKFTTEFNKRPAAKNKNYFPADLLELLLLSETVVISDPDFLATEAHNIMAVHANLLETINELYIQGLISNLELLHRTVMSATQAMMDLNGLENRKQYEQDQLEIKVAQAKQNAEKEAN